MLGSLRFRLPALFLAGIVLAGIVSAAIAFRLLQNYSEDRSLKELRREASGLTRLYAQQAIKASDEGRFAPAFIGRELEKATGDRLYYAGLPLFPGQAVGLRRIQPGLVDWKAIRAGRPVTFEFTPSDEHRPYLAVGYPVSLEGSVFGALVVAKPKTVLRDTWMTLMKFFGVSLLGGLVVAGALAWYASRRITKPVLSLSRAADEIAEGRYDIDVPALRGGDEISHLAERFREMATRLSEAEELERNFLMSVSHELRTPLTAIRGHVEALREGVAEAPAARAESLAVIAAESDRLERLVGDVLDLAKLDAHRFTVLREEVDMGRLLDRAYASFGEEARRRGIDYRYEVANRTVITTDGDRVLQIISNLLANAFRWTPDGGRIELTLDSDNGAVSVAVTDTGPGIGSEEQERIFRPFWSRDGGGTGLGLTIAHELAVALGGRIDLASEKGYGSRFELMLPATPAEVAVLSR
jgi:two-component system OmpR family sensor kinase